MDTLFWIAVGLLVGWQVPQPTFVANLWTKVKAKFSKKA